MYTDVIDGMLKEVYEKAKNENDNRHEMDTLLLVSTMIEEKISANNADYITEEIDNYFDKIRILIVDIYQLYTLVRRSEINLNNVEYMLDDLKMLSNPINGDIDMTIKRVEEHIKSTKGIENKIIFASIRGVLAEIKEVKEMK